MARDPDVPLLQHAGWTHSSTLIAIVHPWAPHTYNMRYISHPLEQPDYPPSDEQQSSSIGSSWRPNGTTSTPGLQLIHSAKDCDDCFEYALHVEATDDEQSLHILHQTSPHAADSHFHAQSVMLGAEGTFHEGITLGRRLQREDDDSSFAQYRSRLERLERAEMERDELRRHRFRAEGLEQELALVKDALLAAQMAYDDLAQAHAEGSSTSKCPRCDADPPLGDLPTGNDDTGSGGGVAAPLAPISDPDRPVPDVTPEIWEDVNDFPDVKETTHLLEVHGNLSLEDPDEDAFLLEQLQALNPDELEEFWADYRQQHESDNDRPETPEESAEDSRVKFEATTKPLPPIATSDIHHGELSIAQIAELIEEADADLESDAAQLIHLLYQDAEQTVKKDRTPAQVYLILSWIPPKLEDAIDVPITFSSDKGKGRATNATVPLLLPSLPQISARSPARQNEIFVDASAHGIGLVYGDHWLAWKFTPGHPSIPGNSSKLRSRNSNAGINMSWAELIAAELGIRTLISAGLRDCAVILRSDNGGVVTALKRGVWTSRWGLDLVLARVLRLCQSAGLRVMPVWVWGKMNPADGPSRGVYPSKERVLVTPPVVPPYLAGVVSLVCPES